MKTLTVVAAALALPAVALGLEVRDFRYTRELRTPAARLHVFEPDAALVSHAAAGFRDLRILDGRGEQVPWRFAPVAEETAPEPVQLLDAGRRGRFAVALVDRGPRPPVVDRIELDVPQSNFVARVEVASSDDNRNFTRFPSSVIYDVAGAEGRVRSTVVTFPPSMQRYLRLRASGIRRIAGATLSGMGGPRLAAWPGRARLVARNPTRIVLDLRYRNVPVDAVRVTAPAPRFDRPVAIAVSNDARRWTELARAQVFKLPETRPEPVAVAGRGRFVRVTIFNGDDPPLRSPVVEVLRLRQTLLVEGGHGSPLRVVYGNAGLQAPSYEFARLPLENARRRPALLRPERLTADFEPPKDTRSFAARHPAIVTAALVLAAVVVGVGGLLALRRRA